MQQTFPEPIQEPREERKPFAKSIEKFKVQAFPKRIRSLIKPALKNSFSTNVQGTDHERAQFTLLGLLPRFGIIYSKLSGGDPGAKRRQKSPIYFTKATFSSSFLFLFLFLFLSLSLFLFLSFSSSFSYYTFTKQLEVQKVTQPTC